MPISHSGPAAELTLAATSAEVSRAANLLVAALRACGAELLARSFDPGGEADLELEFDRLACVDVYCMMAAVGVELDAASHRRMTAFCQCTKECRAAAAGKVARLTLRLAKPAPSPRTGVEECCRRLLATNSPVYEA